MPRSTQEYSAVPDGIWGEETDRALRLFQANAGLKVDGVAGPKTLRRLDEAIPTFKPKKPCCGNVCRLNHDRATQGASFSVPTGGLSAPSGARFLSDEQKKLAKGVFSNSLDFTHILLSDATGLDRRPFTVALPAVGGAMVIINAGTFEPSGRLLIHELAHAWQSQHAAIPTQFIVASLSSQGIADELLSRFGVDASAYYYTPGRNFASYGAEQIACQVENGEPDILAVIRSAPPYFPHPLNNLSLTGPRFAIMGPGVKRC